MDKVSVRPATRDDSPHLARLRETLWPDTSVAEHARELESFFGGQKISTLPLTVFVAEATDGTLAGFIEVGLRSHADGCDTRQPVGFLEGWLVVESYRRKGVGAKLLAAAEDWARSNGCTEIASDTWIDHPLSQRVHEALEFEVVDRCVHYRKPLWRSSQGY